MSSWTSALEPHERRRATAVALEVARRTADPQRLDDAFAAAATAPAPHAGWQAHTVAEGDAGLALMCGQLDRCFPGAGWDGRAHGFITVAMRAAEEARNLTPGLFAGLGGLAFVVRVLARDGTRYRSLHVALEEALLSACSRALDATRGLPSEPADVRLDVISGLSGIGAGLLCHRESREARAMLVETLETLVAASGSTRRSTAGAIDLGLAHGVPGQLALMALTLAHGVEVDGQRDALRQTCEWLVERRIENEFGIAWPARTTHSRRADEPSRARTAWCYGNPGVARVLWLAGQALAEPRLRALGLEAMETVYRTPVGERAIDSPTFCHGISGLLQITLRFAHDTGLPWFRAAASRLVEQLLNAHEPGARFGYRACAPGVLEGSAGVVLVLLASASDVEPAWDRLFMLS